MTVELLWEPATEVVAPGLLSLTAPDGDEEDRPVWILA